MSRIVTLWISVLLAGAAVAAPAPKAHVPARLAAARPPELRVPGTLRSLRCDAEGTIDALLDKGAYPFHHRRLSPIHGPHPLERILGKRAERIGTFAPDGKTATAVSPLGDAPVDAGTGQTILAQGGIGKKLGLRPDAFLSSFSADGRWSAWFSRSSDPEKAGDTGVGFFDRDRKEITVGPRGFSGPSWVSNEGRLFSARKGGPEGPTVIADREGNVVFPKGGDPGLVPGSVHQSVDGKRLSLVVRTGKRTPVVRTYAMPGWRLLGGTTRGTVTAATLARRLDVLEE